MNVPVYCCASGELHPAAVEQVKRGRYREVIERAAFDGRAAVAVLCSDRSVAEVVRKAVERALRECGVVA